MKNKLENKLELCPFANECATEYGGSDVCEEEGNYNECIIYKELIKFGGKK